MRVLAMVHSFVPVHCAGAEMTAFVLLRHLAARGHRVDVLLSSQTGEPYDIDGIHVWPHTSPGDPFRWFGTPEQPDLVLTYLENSTRAAILCRMHAIPICHLVHNTFEFTKHVIARGPADLVTYHADWVREDFHEFFTDLGGVTVGAEITVHPPVDPADYPDEPSDGTAITLINIWPNKGSKIFYAVAEACPDLEFLGVLGGYGEQDIRDLPNVTIVEHTPHAQMAAQVYARTRILLMPSVYESYGRTAIEAACCGIPTIANPTPGLREALGDAGIFVELDDVEGWISAVRKLSDGRSWRAASRRAHACAARQQPIADMDAWCVMAEEVAHHGGPAAGADH